MKKTLLLLFITLIAKQTFAQAGKIDSLEALLKIAKDDTTRLNLYLKLGDVCDVKDNLKFGLPAAQLAEKLLNSAALNDNGRKRIGRQKAQALKLIAYYYEDKNDTANMFLYEKRSLLVYKEIKDTGNIINALIKMGNYCRNTGNIPRAIELFDEGLRVSKEMNYRKGSAPILKLMALMYFDQGDFVQALERFQGALVIYSDLKQGDGAPDILVNMGFAYGKLKNKNKALECYGKAMAYYEKSKDEYGVSWVYSCIGDMYKETNDLHHALENYKKSLLIARKLEDRTQTFRLLNRIGNVYRDLNDYKNAEDYILQGMTIAVENKNENDISWSNASLAKIYVKQGNYKKAKRYSDLSLVTKRKQLFASTIRDAEQMAATIDSANGDFKSAFKHYRQYIIYRDKLNSDELIKATAKAKFQEEADKRKAEQEKRDILSLAEKKRQQVIIYFVVGVLLIVLVFSSLLYKRFRLTNKQKSVIEKQKELVEEKQKEIIDSIKYAKRIQTALLPTEKYIDKNLGKSLNNNA